MKGLLFVIGLIWCLDLRMYRMLKEGEVICSWRLSKVCWSKHPLLLLLGMFCSFCSNARPSIVENDKG